MSQGFEAEKSRRPKSINGLLIATLAATGIGGAIFRDNLRHHSEAAPEISPYAKRILNNELRPSAVRIGRATVSVIAGEKEGVSIQQDPEVKNGIIILFRKLSDDWTFQVQVKMQQKKDGELLPNTTYYYLVTENLTDENYAADGEISLGGDSKLSDKSVWYGTFNTEADFSNDQHYNTHFGFYTSADKMHRRASMVAVYSEQLARLALDVMKPSAY